MASKKKQEPKKKAQRKQSKQGALQDEDLEQVSGGSSAIDLGNFALDLHRSPLSSELPSLSGVKVEAQTVLPGTPTPPPDGPLPSS